MQPCGSSTRSLRQTPTERPHGTGRSGSSIRASLERRDSPSELLNWTEKTGLKRTSDNSINRDVDCFLRTYVPSRMTKGTMIEDSFTGPLVELGLISDSSDGLAYQFHRGAKPSLPTPVFADRSVPIFGGPAIHQETHSHWRKSHIHQRVRDKFLSWTRIPSSNTLRNSRASRMAPYATTKRRDSNKCTGMETLTKSSYFATIIDNPRDSCRVRSGD